MHLLLFLSAVLCFGLKKRTWEVSEAHTGKGPVVNSPILDSSILGIESNVEGSNEWIEWKKQLEAERLARESIEPQATESNQPTMENKEPNENKTNDNINPDAESSTISRTAEMESTNASKREKEPQVAGTTSGTNPSNQLESIQLWYFIIPAILVILITGGLLAWRASKRRNIVEVLPKELPKVVVDTPVIDIGIPDSVISHNGMVFSSSFETPQDKF
jgi:hypothetical protein